MRRSQVGGILHKHKQEVTGKMPKYYYRKGHYRELRELSRGNPNESVRAILNSEPPGDVTMPEDVFGVWGGRELLACSGWRAAAKGLTLHRTAAHREELSGPSGFPRGLNGKESTCQCKSHWGHSFQP